MWIFGKDKSSVADTAKTNVSAYWEMEKPEDQKILDGICDRAKAFAKKMGYTDEELIAVFKKDM